MPRVIVAPIKHAGFSRRANAVALLRLLNVIRGDTFLMMAMMILTLGATKGQRPILFIITPAEASR